MFAQIYVVSDKRGRAVIMSISEFPGKEGAFRLGPQWGYTAQIRCGFEHIKKTARFPQKITSEQMTVVYLWQGSCAYKPQGGEWLQLEAGWLFLALPGEAQQRIFEVGTRSCFLDVPAPVCDLLCLTRTVSATMERAFNIGIQLDLVAAWEHLMREIRSIPSDELDSCMGKVHAFLADLLCMARKHDSSRMHDMRLHTACEFLRSHLDDHLSLPAIAAKLRMSYSSFRKFFCDQMGMPPGAYRIEQRITTAEHLLREGCPSKEVAALIG